MTDFTNPTTLAARLESLAVELNADPPLGADGAPAQLAAMMTAEPAVGPVAVVAWVADEGEAFSLLRLETGDALHDHTALRETLTLIAMNETLEELAGFDEVRGLSDALKRWLDVAPATGPVDDLFVEAVAAGNAYVDALLALERPAAQAHMATTTRLDQLGGVIRELEKAWEKLEQQAGLWSDAQLETRPDDEQVRGVVRDLWALLAHARRGPLRQPVSAALHGGREAGTAFAAAILESAQG